MIIMPRRYEKRRLHSNRHTYQHANLPKRGAVVKQIKTIVLVTTLSVLASFRVGAQECVRFQSASPDELVSHLGGMVPDRGNASCIAFAINKLGDQHYAPAIAVLAKFLDFRWPADARQKQRLFVLEHDGASIYPAVNALGKIGQNSLPFVLEVIKADPVSRVTRENAVSVWMQIYKTQSLVGVMLLKQEADRTKDPAIRQRVGWAAFKAVSWCAPADQDQCKAALNARYSN